MSEHSPAQGTGAAGDRHKWVALANTTAAVFMSVLDGSIVLIALPAIFRGIHLDPLAPGNVGYRPAGSWRRPEPAPARTSDGRSCACASRADVRSN
jgi:hypothetical protein